MRNQVNLRHESHVSHQGVNARLVKRQHFIGAEKSGLSG